MKIFIESLGREFDLPIEEKTNLYEGIDLQKINLQNIANFYGCEASINISYKDLKYDILFTISNKIIVNKKYFNNFKIYLNIIVLAIMLRNNTSFTYSSFKKELYKFLCVGTGESIPTEEEINLVV